MSYICIIIYSSDISILPACQLTSISDIFS